MYEIPQEVLDYFGKFSWFDKSKIIIDQSDGLWIYSGDIEFSEDKDFVEFPEWFTNFKEIRGNLDCYRTSITDFTGLNNLKEILGNLWCSGTSITSFNGLENLTKIGRGLFCHETSITDFTGLENLRSIGSHLDCTRTPLKDFTGLEKLKNIGDSIYCFYTPLKSFKGLEQCEINPDEINPVELREIYKEWKKSKQIKEISKFLECV